ncbi:unnamed protein product [Eruca vesicaria subsp. sativa]|uniref:Uncharacterized protein n=1 Tax=Eruca vesicaria subsp. sativa TaxID=29727 RepID=A0ABC8K3V5_ERUVS|nr:unnamed protein product [Eruca vesicaria subsp. sativa]
MATVQVLKVEQVSPTTAENDEIPPLKTEMPVGTAYCVDIVECEASYGEKNIDMVVEETEKPSEEEEMIESEVNKNTTGL